MKKIYVVTKGDYDEDYCICGVFSKEATATAFAKECGYGDSDGDVEAWFLDEMAGAIKTQFWAAMIDLETGVVGAQIGDKHQLSQPLLPGQSPATDYLTNPPRVRVYSVKSAEHACRLAMKHRQGWLRKQSSDGRLASRPLEEKRDV